MRNYDVTITYQGSITFPIKARSADDAKIEAQKKLNNGVHVNAMRKGCTKISVDAVEEA